MKFLGWDCWVILLSFHFQQATGLKGEVASDQTSKTPKVGTVAADVAKAENSSTTTSPVSTVVALPPADNSNAAENFVANGSQTNAIAEEDATLKQSIRPLAPVVGAPFVMNRFKLDNRPTSFKIIPPLPTGLANVIFSSPCNYYVVVMLHILWNGSLSIYMYVYSGMPLKLVLFLIRNHKHELRI